MQVLVNFEFDQHVDAQSYNVSNAIKWKMPDYLPDHEELPKVDNATACEFRGSHSRIMEIRTVNCIM